MSPKVFLAIAAVAIPWAVWMDSNRPSAAIRHVTAVTDAQKWLTHLQTTYPDPGTVATMSAQAVRTELHDFCQGIAMTYAHMGEGYYDQGKPGSLENPLANLIEAYRTHAPACINPDNGFSAPYSDAAARKALAKACAEVWADPMIQRSFTDARQTLEAAKAVVAQDQQ
jgi:hypothetical protein